MTAVIWGSDGQDGFYLSDFLRAGGYEVLGVGKGRDSLRIDSTNFREVRDFIARHKPACIVHFAANSTTSHDVWKENHDTISTGCLNILEAIREVSPGSKLFLSGSGLQFVNNGKPIKESDEFEAKSIYAATRIHTVYLARYFRSIGVKAYVGYFFNHDSPIRGERHINKKIMEAAKRIAAGGTEKLVIGDLSVRKEFGFAGDIVRAVWKLMKQDAVYEAVIGTGVAYSIAQWVELCFRLNGLNWQDHVEVAEAFSPEYSVLVSDPQTIQSLGWEHETTMEELAKMML